MGKESIDERRKKMFEEHEREMERKRKEGVNNIEEYEKKEEELKILTDRIESILDKKGGFDFLRKDFWKDFSEAEFEVSPEINPTKKFDVFGFGKDSYFARLIAIDTFNSIKNKKLLDNSDKDVFLEAMPIFSEYSFENKKDMSEFRMRSLLPKTRCQILEKQLRSIEKIKQYPKVDEIEKAIKERLHIHGLIHFMPSVTYKRPNKENIIESDFQIKKDFTLYKKHEEQFYSSGKDLYFLDQNKKRFARGGAWWSHSHGNALIFLARNLSAKDGGFEEMAKAMKNKINKLNEVEEDKD